MAKKKKKGRRKKKKFSFKKWGINTAIIILFFLWGFSLYNMIEEKLKNPLWIFLITSAIIIILLLIGVIKKRTALQKLQGVFSS